MPTFLKDLSNFQVKLIWQNAGVELMEARRLVFVGYSLPSADFEFRQLLSGMVHKDTKIEVFLWDRASTFSDEEKQSLVVHRDDFWASTSNKQLNFIQLATGRVRPTADTSSPS